MFRFYHFGLFGFSPVVSIVGGWIFIFGIVFLIRRSLLSHPKEQLMKKQTPLEILTERFAHGELSIEEFEARAKTLEMHHPDRAA